MIVYNIFLHLYKIGVYIFSLWNQRARLWLNGRQNIFEEIKSKIGNLEAKIIWFHCSSLGEFEQGRPLIEKLKSLYPNYKILLTFFSPSGYEIMKNYKNANWVFYLPLDSKKNAGRFFDIVKPSLVVFVKYDYWYYYINESRNRNIPLLMVSAIFRRQQPFFKWYGSLHRKMLKGFTHFFVQDDASFELLRSINLNNKTVAGDTRYDRVSEIAGNFKRIEEIEKFINNSEVLVAGSTWPNDEKLIKEATTDVQNLKIVIAPHEIDKKHLTQLKHTFPHSIFFSDLKNDDRKQLTSNQLIIDNIGMLSRLYHYATITYIGGGFDKGIHNTLEAAVYGKPVLFGPNYQKFNEAIGLIEKGGAFSVSSSPDLSTKLKMLLNDQNKLELSSKNSLQFVKENIGATEKILSYIQENRLLTN